MPPSNDISGTDAVIEGRRNTDMASAIAIAELRVELRGLSQVVKDSYAILTSSLNKIQSEQDVSRTTYSSIQREVHMAVGEAKRELLEDFKEHTHNDLAPHHGTLGKRVNSLETSRTYTKGILAVGIVLMPVGTAFLTKWLTGG